MNQPMRRPPRPTDTEETLMQRVAVGDQLAHAALVSRWHARILRFLHRRTGDQALAREAHDKVWQQVCHGRHHYDPADRFALWLFAIAARTGVDARLPSTHGFARSPAGAEDGVRDGVLAGLHQLDPVNRRVVLLHVEGFAPQEVALALQLTVEDTRRRLRTARRWLQPSAPEGGEPLALVRTIGHLQTPVGRA